MPSSNRVSRRDALKSSAALFGVASGGAQTKMSRPNILFLMADQHRADCLGVEGNRAIHTPNLDRIAHEGVRFRHAYSSTPTCTPARTALLTGLSPWNHGMLGMGQVAERYPLEMPRALRDAGYYTMGIGKMHWHPQRNAHGFHRMVLDESGREETPDFRSDYRSWFWSQAPNLDPDATGIGWNDYTAKPYALPEALHPTRWISDVAVSFLESYQRPEPFFLKVSWERPHSPYDPPERLFRRYADAPIPPAAVGAWAAKYAPRSWPKDDIWHGAMATEAIRHSRQGYYGSVTFVDEQIGRILNTLERRGWLEQTLILYVSDHGDMTGDHNLWRKSYAYESSARVPLLMRWPAGMVSAPRGRTLDEPVEIRDILPTFLEAAGTEPKERIDGRSLLGPAAGKARDWRTTIDLEHDVCYSPENHWNALTDGRWKYIFHAPDGAEQLFHLERDPAELNDLAGTSEHADTLRIWRNRLIEHLAVRGDRFVKNGRLALRPERMLYGPNYPGKPRANMQSRA